MKIQFAIPLFLWLTVMGCNPPKNSKPSPATPPVPSLPSKPEKTCEGLFAEAVSAKWKKVEGKTVYPGFVRDDGLISLLTGEMKPCLLGKDKSFVVSQLGQPSVEHHARLFSYHCYPALNTELDSSRCLSFRLGEDLKVSDVLFWKCRSKID